MELDIKHVYDKIAKEFDTTRYSIWTSVKKFLDSLPANSVVLDNGCGNGKNMLYRKDLQMVGIDISKEQVNICKAKGLTVIESSMILLNFPDNYFDNIICVASYHHLDNDLDRQLALNEMYRCLKKGGQILITVWAMEQEPDSLYTFYNKDEMVPWKSKDGNVYYRYYHIYSRGELEEEITRLAPQFKILLSEYEKGNHINKLNKI